jgi:long-chain acyl-CoA synthetase
LLGCLTGVLGAQQFSSSPGKIEQIKKFCLIAASWEPSRTDGTAAELTPTMKLKRRVIRDKYQQDIEAIYS